GNSKSDGGCTPGQSISCAGENGCAGHQVCRADGTAFDGCICGPNSSHADGGYTDSGPHSGLLGAQCETDDNCRKGLICLGTTSTKLAGEGPGGGLCTAPCTGDATACAK